MSDGTDFPFGANEPPKPLVPAQSVHNHPLIAPYARLIPVTSLDLTRREGRVALYRAMQGAEFELSEVLDAELVIRDYVIFAGTMGDMETGENKPIIRVTLIGPDGTRYSSASEGIARSIVGLCAAFGPPPWPEGITVVPKEETNPRTKRRYQTLDVVV